MPHESAVDHLIKEHSSSCLSLFCFFFLRAAFSSWGGVHWDALGLAAGLGCGALGLAAGLGWDALGRFDVVAIFFFRMLAGSVSLNGFSF